MKRVAMVLCMLSGLILVPVALPSAARASSGSYDFAVGGGKAAFFDFAFSVHCQATGTATCTLDSGSVAPTGHVVKKYLDPSTNKQDTVQGDVTCAAFAGNIAGITWVVTHSDDAAYPIGSIWTFGVQDNGPPVQGRSPDFIGLDTLSTADACAAIGLTNPYSAGGLLSGNIVVSDGFSLLPGVAMSGDWWYTDTAGNLYVLDSTGNWVLVQ